MSHRQPPRPHVDDDRRARRRRVAFVLALLCSFLAAQVAHAASLEDYRARLEHVNDAVEELYWTFDEDTEAKSAGFLATEKRTLDEARTALPASERVEWAGGAADVDNSWLHQALDNYAKIPTDKTDERETALSDLSERLNALLKSVTDAAQTQTGARDKEAEKGRLNAILRRPEYNEQAAQETAFERLMQSIRRVINNLFPKSGPLNPGAAGLLSILARVFVYVLCLAALIFVAWKYGARLLPRNRAPKQRQPEARVVLGERLAPGETPADLFAQAEALARAGDLRAAIRKAYIAVLFELGERDILRLAAHKTNRDYLSALRRERTALYGDMQPLTNNYERHWYGFAPATDTDWQDFRSRCRQLTEG